MDDLDEWRLLQNHDILTQDIPTIEVCQKLRSGPNRLFSQTDNEIIESKPTTLGKNEKLLDILRTKGPKAYRALRTSLQELEMDHLVQALDQTDLTDYEYPVFADEPQAQAKTSGITRAAVGRFAKIGDLYDAATDNFLAKSSLEPSWKALDIKVSPTNDEPSIQLLEIKSLKQKLEKLNIGNDLSASILLDMVRVEGSGSILKFFGKSYDKVLLYKVTTENHSFDVIKNIHLIDRNVLKECVVTGATHVVAGIDWGAVCYVTSDVGPCTESDIRRGLEDIEETLKGESDKHANTTQSLDERLQETGSALFRFFSDIRLQDNGKPVSIEKALELAGFVRNGNPLPIQFHLLSIQDLIEQCQLEVPIKPTFIELDDEDLVHRLTRYVEDFETFFVDWNAKRDYLYNFDRFNNNESLKYADEFVSQIREERAGSVIELKKKCVKKTKN